MDNTKKAARYQRIYVQLKELLQKTDDHMARMASISAVLHHKMDHYFWTGFYLLKADKLVVGPYQGPVACQELEKDKGVCWATIHQEAPVIVPDVHQFPDHIACDSRSRSEITIPVIDSQQKITAVFDVDSDQLNAFNDIDRDHLQKIIELIYS